MVSYLTRMGEVDSEMKICRKDTEKNRQKVRSASARRNGRVFLKRPGPVIVIASSSSCFFSRCKRSIYLERSSYIRDCTMLTKYSCT